MAGEEVSTTVEQAPQVDIEQIMREIEQQAAEQEAKSEPIPAFAGVQGSFTEPAYDPSLPISVIPSDGGIMHQLAEGTWALRGSERVLFYRELGGGAKGLAKRVVRKLIKSVILPMSEEQNSINLQVSESIDTACQVADYQQVQLNNIQEALNQLHAELSELSEQVARLS